MAALNSNGLTVRVTSATTETILGTDDVVVFTAATAKTAALPGATLSTTQPGKVYNLTNTGANTVTVTPTAGLIDGAANKVIAAGGTAISALRIVSDGTQWRTIGYTVGS